MYNKNKLIGYALVALGVLDIIMWWKLRYGWTNQILGNNILTQYGWGIMIAGGLHFIRKAKAVEQILLDDVDADDDEVVVHKESGRDAIIILTTNKLKFYGFNVSHLRDSIPNFPNQDNLIFDLHQIENVRFVMSKEVALIGKLIPFKWGIQVVLSDGQIFNLPISNSELVAKLCNKQIKKIKNEAS
jgi:hypothetical protein